MRLYPFRFPTIKVAKGARLSLGGDLPSRARHAYLLPRRCKHVHTLNAYKRKKAKKNKRTVDLAIGEGPTKQPKTGPSSSLGIANAPPYPFLMTPCSVRDSSTPLVLPCSPPCSSTPAILASTAMDPLLPCWLTRLDLLPCRCHALLPEHPIVPPPAPPPTPATPLPVSCLSSSTQPPCLLHRRRPSLPLPPPWAAQGTAYPLGTAVTLRLGIRRI